MKEGGSGEGGSGGGREGGSGGGREWRREGGKKGEREGERERRKGHLIVENCQHDCSPTSGLDVGIHKGPTANELSDNGVMATLRGCHQWSERFHFLFSIHLCPFCQQHLQRRHDVALQNFISELTVCLNTIVYLQVQDSLQT